MRTVWQVTVWVAAIMLLVVDTVSSTGFSCNLECANGGYCALIEGTSEELGRQAQSGHLIEKCICPQGFTGIACDVVVEQCHLPDHTCSNGMPCTQNALGEWGCDCSIADSLSVFAGHQCRNPITEYCSGKYEPDEAVSFCTNGGRCVGDFLAAQVAPGDTAFNKAYQERGCKCPREFHGPHCEFLKFADDETQGTLVESNPATSTTTKSPHSSFMTAILVLISMALVLMVSSLARYKYRLRTTKEVPPEVITFEQGVAMWESSSYRDSRLNGRHHPFDRNQQQNLRIISLFEDDHELA